VKSSLAAEGAQILPATATLYCMGIELISVNSWDCAPITVDQADVQHLQQQGGSSSLAEQQLQEGAASAPQDRGTGVNLQALQAYRCGVSAI
jgi:hypothetical protein